VKKLFIANKHDDQSHIVVIENNFLNIN